jgi:hypothetical protein
MVRRRACAVSKNDSLFVMAGLVPAIDVFLDADAKDVDARDKPGHGELSINPRFYWLHFESDSQDQ